MINLDREIPGTKQCIVCKEYLVKSNFKMKNNGLPCLTCLDCRKRRRLIEIKSIENAPLAHIEKTRQLGTKCSQCKKMKPDTEYGLKKSGEQLKTCHACLEKIRWHKQDKRCTKEKFLIATNQLSKFRICHLCLSPAYIEEFQPKCSSVLNKTCRSCINKISRVNIFVEPEYN